MTSGDSLPTPEPRNSHRRAVGRLVLSRSGRRTAAVSTLLMAVAAAQVGLGAVPASAATLTVTSTADVAANFGACGNSAQLTSSGSLREALCAANNGGTTPATIAVAAGRYVLTNGQLQMGMVPGSNITLTGAGAASTIIDGNDASRVFNLDPSLAGGVTTSISGVTITNGLATTFGGAGIIGGSLSATAKDTLTISSSTISNNDVASTSTSLTGGGLQFVGGSLTITNSTISGNTAGSANGSGVYYRATGAAAGEQLTISGTTFSGNSTNASVSGSNVGGALATAGVGAVPMSVSTSRFTGNTVVGSGTGIPQGGAIFAQGGALTVTESTFTGNSVTGGSNPQGGAVSVTGGTAALHDNRITGNTGATGSGVSLGGSSGATLDATDNWWGCNTGPGTAGCDTAAGGPTVSPRLVLTATASPATVVGPNASSTITAALTTNSLGSAIGASDLDAFAGQPVSFSDPLPSGATVGASSANLSSGVASTTYSSQSTSGPGHVLAILDNGTATATITVNRPPAITSANTAAFPFGTASSFTVTTSGYPGPAITKTGTVPPGMTFTDNGNGTATVSGTPSASGSYPLGLTANNGVSPNATQTLTLSVTQAPVFTTPNAATFTVGTGSAFAIGTTSSAYPTPVVISYVGTLPSGLSLTDNGDGTATLAGTPAAGSGGAYSLSLTASNGVNPDGTQSLTVNVKQAPAVTTDPADQTVTSGASVSFATAASGFPAPTVQWQRSTDSGASFTDIALATSTTYTFTAASRDNGNMYRAVVTNSAGTATSTAATLTVDTAPTISTPNTTSFTVGTLSAFAVGTTGFPDPTLTTTGTLPAWLSFTDNGDGTATMAGTPPTGSGGTYSFTIVADNGTAPSASQGFILTVRESPTVTSADHASFKIGTAGSFLVTTAAGFPVATTLAKTGTLPSGVTFTDNGNGTASLAGTPASGTAGSYPITLTASNGASTNATQSFTLTVTEAPSFTSADHATFTVASAGSFSVTTSGGAGSITISETGTLPSGVAFTDNGDGTATLSGTPATGSGGTYSMTFTASDGVDTDGLQSFTLTVLQPTAITSTDHVTFTLGVADAFTVTTTPGVPASTTITESGALPSGISFTDNGDGTATLGGTASAAGSFPITITAGNGVVPDATQSFTITVVQPPAFTSADHTTVAVGSAGSFTVTTSPAADTITATGSLPSGVSLTDNGDGTATLAGTPVAGTGGTYALLLTATNATGATSQTFTLTVHELPTFTSTDHTTFVVGTVGSFTVTTTAGYPAATTVTEAGSLPSGVSFTDNGDGTATLAGTPASGTAGSYPLTLSATNGTGTRQQGYTLTVQPANASPVITSADSTTFAVDAAGSYTVTTTAGYPTATTLGETGPLPTGVTFTDNGDGTATLAGTPGTAGAFPLTISAGNGASTDATQSFTLTVTKTPTFTSGLGTTFAVGTAGSFTVTTTAGYPAATTLSLTGSLPSGVSFIDHGNGSATLSGTPASGTVGSYPVTLAAANTAGTTHQLFTLTVQPANASAAITSVDRATFGLGTPGSFTVTTTPGYPTATALTETGGLPAGLTFTDNGDGTATLAGTPATAGAFTITVTASNGASTDATQRLLLTVVTPPYLTSVASTTFTAGSPGTFTVTAAAGYPTTTTLRSTGALPSGVTFTDNGDGTATLAGTPAAASAGSYPLTVTASNGVGPDASQSFTLTVQPAAAPPPDLPAHAVLVAPTTGYAPTSLTLSGQRSSDDHGIVRWYFICGNGQRITRTSAATAEATCRFVVARRYTAYLQVTDTAGHVSTTSSLITVGAHVPATTAGESISQARSNLYAVGIHPGDNLGGPAPRGYRYAFAYYAFHTPAGYPRVYPGRKVPYGTLVYVVARFVRT